MKLTETPLYKAACKRVRGLIEDHEREYPHSTLESMWFSLQTFEPRAISRALEAIIIETDAHNAYIVMKRAYPELLLVKPENGWGLQEFCQANKNPFNKNELKTEATKRLSSEEKELAALQEEIEELKAKKEKLKKEIAKQAQLEEQRRKQTEPYFKVGDNVLVEARITAVYKKDEYELEQTAYNIIINSDIVPKVTTMLIKKENSIFPNLLKHLEDYEKRTDDKAWLKTEFVTRDQEWPLEIRPATTRRFSKDEAILIATKILRDMKKVKKAE